VIRRRLLECEWRNGKNVKRNEAVVAYSKLLSQNMDEGKAKFLSVNVRAEIWTWDLSNTRQEWYALDCGVVCVIHKSISGTHLFWKKYSEDKVHMSLSLYKLLPYRIVCFPPAREMHVLNVGRAKEEWEHLPFTLILMEKRVKRIIIKWCSLYSRLERRIQFSLSAKFKALKINYQNNRWVREYWKDDSWHATWVVSAFIH
jgi:hypothetical protein